MWRTSRAQRLACATARPIVRSVRAEIWSARLDAANRLGGTDRDVGICDRKIREADASAIGHSARREVAAGGCAGKFERYSSATGTVDQIKSEPERLCDHSR